MIEYDAEMTVTVPNLDPNGGLDYMISWPYNSKLITGEELLATLLDIFDKRKFTVKYKVAQVTTGHVPPKETAS